MSSRSSPSSASRVETMSNPCGPQSSSDRIVSSPSVGTADPNAAATYRQNRSAGRS